MLIAYFASLVFQLWTHRLLFEAHDEDDNDDSVSEEAVIGFWSGFSWLAGMTVFIAMESTLPASPYELLTCFSSKRVFQQKISISSIP
ncbi:hypothetical protein K1719_017236 [Acacia pycnantha]|nr:hypothetical protein K1719_017236 [Acacia pycnantha]